MANFREGSGYCDHCRREVLVRQEQPNHVLHLLLTLLCCGWWIFPWLLITLSAQSKGWRCSRCGRVVPGSMVSGIVVGMMLVAVAVVLTFAIGGCVVASRSGRDRRPPTEEQVAPPPQAPEHRPREQEPPAESGPMPRVAGERKPPTEPAGPDRKAVYLRLIRVDEQVEAAAVKKYGRKPTKEDNAGFTAPYRAFVERETEKALDALAKELALPRYELTAVRREGDKEGWPKK